MAIPFPIIITERLNLRKIIPSDLDRVHFLRSDKAINKYIKREPQTLETAKAHIERLDSNLKRDIISLKIKKMPKWVTTSTQNFKAREL